MVPMYPGYVFGGTGFVLLLVRPEVGITWGMWGDTLRGLRLFGEIWEFVGLEFEVLDQAGGEKGTGGVQVGVGRLWGV